MTKFMNRRAAGRQLAAKILREGLDEHDPTSLADHVVVLGIPRGGIVVADEIARALNAPLDVIITRKIGAPSNEELAIGAVASDGTFLLDRGLVHDLHISARQVEEARRTATREIDRRIEMYRRGRPPLALADKTVVVADDGIATGATTFVALHALRHQNPAKLILAVPVAPPQVVPQLRAACDQLIVLLTPEPFVAVGYFFEDFSQVSDREVVEILQSSQPG